jgi:hypothetical protein
MNNLKNNVMKKIYFLFSIFMMSFTTLNAQLLVEDFNYTAGDLLTSKGWSSHSGGTTNPILVTSPGLTFTGYVGSNIGLAAGINNTGQDLNKLFAAQTAPGSIYISFLVNAPATHTLGGYFFHYFDPALTTSHRARTFITPKTGKMMVGFSFNASIQQDSLSTLLNFGETYLFVAKYKIVEGEKNDEVSLYVFKAGDDFTNEPAKPTLGPLKATLSSPSDPNSGLAPDIVPTGIALRQYDSGEKITVDGFRVKTKWDLKKDDVTMVNNVINNEIKIYPNPVIDGVIYISSAVNTEKQIEVFDITGRKLINETTTLNQMNVSVLNPGLYVMKIKANGETVTSKFNVN